ncbi:MAG: DUF4177 domain-containing protein [Planctomycetaceae bacterium]|nr:DUF4177 domain-containing protein [Planctomycetaceae bacterium]
MATSLGYPTCKGCNDMKKWEYKIIDSKDVPGGGIFKGKDRSDVEEYLNQFGRKGWEIINIDFRELEDRYAFTGVAKRYIDA